jgi:hypothetical protein
MVYIVLVGEPAQVGRSQPHGGEIAKLNCEVPGSDSEFDGVLVGLEE